jgi:hypothetical protein
MAIRTAWRENTLKSFEEWTFETARDPAIGRVSKAIHREVSRGAA